jgi:hypothetical protein
MLSLPSKSDGLLFRWEIGQRVNREKIITISVDNSAPIIPDINQGDITRLEIEGKLI